MKVTIYKDANCAWCNLGDSSLYGKDENEIIDCLEKMSELSKTKQEIEVLVPEMIYPSKQES